MSSSILPTAKINSLEFFHINWKVWKIIGLRLFKRDVHTQQRLPVSRLYLSWSNEANFVVTILFPIHLSMGIFDNKSKLFDGLNVTITSIGATVKFFLMASKMKQIAQMEALIQVLDARVTHLEELEHYRTRIRLNILNIQRMYLSLYSGIGVALAASILFSKERRLLYPGWLPFDWRTSTGYYALAMLYQLFGFAIQISQTFSNDSFAPKTLCILSAHIELLYKRVSRIGFDGPYAGDSGSKAALVQQEEELKQCVLDQINLYELYKTIQDIISWAMVIQLLVSVLNNCVAMVALLFFATELFDRIYYSIYIVGLAMQLFPSCYYGSDFVLLFEKLHYAVFSCNWIGQSKSFKRHMMIFTERSLRQTMALAGGMFPIHLDTFFATAKATYSLFALIITIK
ncbi:odorant receptor 59a-like [Stomoxys calcitrans]|uniref:odorant receptor 59a-like n=1 Tax=Stomoxys calcitrans TaxID=35570 RepID=UPI0027E3AAED|nr:odorant receptor 59a-like [Stomoxys calcitrans]